MTNSGQRTRSRAFLWLILAAIILIIAALLWKTYRIYSAVDALRGRQTELEQLVGDGGITGIDPDAAEALIVNVRKDVLTLDSETAPFMFLTPYLGWVPRVGSTLENAESLMTMADAGTSAATYLVTSLKPGLALMQGESAANLPALIGVVDDADGAIAAANSELDRVALAQSTIEDWSELPWTVQQLQSPLQDLLPLGQSGLQLAQILPEMLGKNGERNYLIIAQNEDERRATGGFISGVGLIKLVDGDIAEMTFSASEPIDCYFDKPYDIPPAPFENFMGLELFSFRDSNFWPDFPTSAERVIYQFTYCQDQSPPIDGVIAIDQRFVEAIIKVVGPVNVPDQNFTANGNNIIEQMRNTWNPDESEESNRDWVLNRKSFMGSLAQATMAKVMSNPGAIDLTGLLQAMIESAELKHVQFYLRDQRAASVIDELGWSGRLPEPGESDYLLVLDTNMGYNKVNAVVEREITYEVSLDSNSAGTGLLTLDYNNGGRPSPEPCDHYPSYNLEIQYTDLINSCYWNYLRVYAPAGAVLIDATRHPAPAPWFVTQRAWNGTASTVIDPSPFTVFDNFMVVQQAERMQSQMQYQLPAGVVRDIGNNTLRYELTVVKQAGARPQPLQILVNFPPNATSARSTPMFTSQNGRTLVFEATLDQDLHFTIDFRN